MRAPCLTGNQLLLADLNGKEQYYQLAKIAIAWEKI